MLRRTCLRAPALSFNAFPQVDEQSNEIAQKVICVYAAGIGEHPDPRGTDCLRLLTHRSTGRAEPLAVGVDAKHREYLRPEPQDLFLEHFRAGPQFIGRKLVCLRGRIVEDIRNAAVEIEELRLFLGVQEPVGKARVEEGNPEPVAGPGEMVAHCARVKAGVDAAEEDFQIERDDIGNSPPGGGEQLLFCRAGPGRRTHAVINIGGVAAPGKGELLFMSIERSFCLLYV